jgi:hypothetical protein
MLVAAFPSASEGRQIKQDLLDSTRASIGCSANLAEPELLSALVATPSWSSFDAGRSWD